MTGAHDEPLRHVHGCRKHHDKKVASSKKNKKTNPRLECKKSIPIYYQNGGKMAKIDITSHITCNTKNLIYMVQCNHCHLQYIGETKRRLKDRFNEHRRPVDKTNITSKPTTFSEHFLSQPNHCHTDMQLIPLEVIHSSRDSIRKARESIAGTLEPHGFNRRDEL